MHKKEEEERFKPSKKPTLELSAKKDWSEARSKTIHDPLLQTSQKIQEIIAS